jgi:hypothetical protein
MQGMPESARQFSLWKIMGNTLPKVVKNGICPRPIAIVRKEIWQVHTFLSIVRSSKVQKHEKRVHFQRFGLFTKG